jgi:hypothetical protein
VLDVTDCIEEKKKNELLIMKFYNNIATPLWMAAFVPTILSISLDVTHEVLSDKFVTDENDILDPLYQSTNADVLNQNTNFSDGNKLSNASLINPQGQLKSLSSYVYFIVRLHFLCPPKMYTYFHDD